MTLKQRHTTISPPNVCRKTVGSPVRTRVSERRASTNRSSQEHAHKDGLTLRKDDGDWGAAPIAVHPPWYDVAK
jgi:hypothetical protein